MPKVARTFLIDMDKVSCRNCQYCYPSPSDPDPSDTVYGTFCQEYSFSIPTSEEECIERGNDCLQWIPRDFSRAFVKSDWDSLRVPRWYELLD